MKVCFVGNAVLDYIAKVKAFPERDCKIRTQSMEMSGGGNSLAGACCVSRLGGKSKLIAKFGLDSVGDQTLKVLKDAGVDVESVVIDKSVTSPFSYIIVEPSGERTIMITQSDPVKADEIKEEMLNDVSMLVLDGEFPHACVRLCQIAKKKGIPCLLDGEQHALQIDGYREVIPGCNMIVGNTRFYKDFTQKQDVLEAMLELLGDKETGKDWIIATNGEEGSVAMSWDDKHVPAKAEQEEVESWEEFVGCVAASSSAQEHTLDKAIQCGRYKGVNVIHCKARYLAAEEVVDTTGAGDVYVGTVAYMSQKYDLCTAMLVASYVAAIKCTGFGGVKSVPYQKDIQHLLELQ